MWKKIANIFFTLTIVFSVFKFLFFPLVEITDSWFFWGLAEFFKTGTYHAPHPFYYTSPSTMEPPLYSFFIYIFQFFPRTDIFIHLLQITGFAAAAFCIYKILSAHISSDMAKIIAMLFLYIPANIIYESQLAAEPLALSFVAIYIFMSFQIFYRKNYGFVKYLIFFSVFMTLQKYNFIIFFLISLFLFFKTKKRKILDIYFVLLSILILVLWILINHNLNGSWGLSNAEGKHLYNKIVWVDGITPKAGDPNLNLLKSLTKRETTLTQPWWWIEDKLRTEAGMSETESSNLLGKIAISALLNNPWQFAANIPKNLLISHGNKLPFSGGGYLYTRAENPKPYCRSLGNLTFCQPIIQNELAISLWENLIIITRIYYSSFFPIIINFLIFFPGLVYIFFRGDKFIKFCALSYFLTSMIPILVEEPNTRYIYPLFPLKIIIIVYFLQKMKKILRYSIIRASGMIESTR